ncbi:MAG: precorrin-2 C(20)-methyltransferase [Pseudomonadota bacterium]
MSAGTLYGVGVGPGDPELVTLKAARLIRSADVVAYPVNGAGHSFARRIVADVVSPDADHLPITVPMKVERGPAQCAYDDAAEQISMHLRRGKNVVFLCEGDPFFFGSYMYIHQRVCGSYECEVVPGVTSLTACAAELGRPLAARNEVLKVLPGPLGEDELLRELRFCQSAAIIKVGRHFEKIRRVLRQCGLADSAWIVEAATNPGQKIIALEAVAEGEKPYFSTILVYSGGENW